MGFVQNSTLAKEFYEQMESHFSKPEIWDTSVDLMLHEEFVKILKNPVNKFPPRNQYYFSPSSVNSCPRGLILKMQKAKKDIEDKKPWQARWQSLGTTIGSMFQREVLMSELRGNQAFTMERNANNQPFFEEFVKENTKIRYKGHEFFLFGTTDGVLRYVNKETGEVKRVILEIKSKQTSAARTSLFSMKNPEESHTKQTIAYKIMYSHYFEEPITDVLIVYLNSSKKKWDMDQETYEKNPDFRVFHFTVEPSEEIELLNSLIKIIESYESGYYPLPDLDKWQFNPYKTAIAKTLLDDEFVRLKEQAKMMMQSGLPDYKKMAYFDAIKFIEEVRNG